jgi:hypothetical protein
VSRAAAPSSRKIRLTQPAARWEDALPAGNGHVGAMVYGSIAHDVVLLNHEALWLRRPRPSLPDVSHHLPALRALLLDGHYDEAQFFLDERLREGGYEYEEVDPFQPAFDIRIEMQPGRAIRDYCRELDLTSGEVAVRWASDAGMFTRELFVSRVDGVVVMRITAAGGSFDARVSLAPHGWQARTVFEGTTRAESLPDTDTTFQTWSTTSRRRRSCFGSRWTSRASRRDRSSAKRGRHGPSTTTRWFVVTGPSISTSCRGSTSASVRPTDPRLS